MEPSGVLAPSEWSEILPPLQTFGYLAALTASALLLLAAILTVYLAAGVRVKAWSLRVNSFVTLLFNKVPVPKETVSIWEWKKYNTNKIL